MLPLFLRLGESKASQKVLGMVTDAAQIPELLRHVADYYDDHPDDLAQLFADGSAQLRVGPSFMVDPFAVVGAAHRLPRRSSSAN